MHRGLSGLCSAAPSGRLPESWFSRARLRIRSRQRNSRCTSRIANQDSRAKAVFCSYGRIRTVGVPSETRPYDETLDSNPALFLVDPVARRHSGAREPCAGIAAFRARVSMSPRARHSQDLVHPRIPTEGPLQDFRATVLSKFLSGHKKGPTIVSPEGVLVGSDDRCFVNNWVFRRSCASPPGKKTDGRKLPGTLLKFDPASTRR